MHEERVAQQTLPAGRRKEYPESAEDIEVFRTTLKEVLLSFDNNAEE